MICIVPLFSLVISILSSDYINTSAEANMRREQYKNNLEKVFIDSDD